MDEYGLTVMIRKNQEAVALARSAKKNVTCEKMKMRKALVQRERCAANVKCPLAWFFQTFSTEIIPDVLHHATPRLINSKFQTKQKGNKMNREKWLQSLTGFYSCSKFSKRGDSIYQGEKTC